MQGKSSVQVMNQMGNNYGGMNQQGQHMQNHGSHTQPQPGQVQKPMTQSSSLALQTAQPVEEKMFHSLKSG